MTSCSQCPRLKLDSDSGGGADEADAYDRGNPMPGTTSVSRCLTPKITIVCKHAEQFWNSSRRSWENKTHILNAALATSPELKQT